MKDYKQVFWEIKKQQDNLKDLHIDSNVLETGLKVSKQALFSTEDVALTPYTRNMMEKMDPSIKELKAGDPETKMEKYLTQKTLEILEKYCGKEKTNYDKSKSVTDIDHYYVDCWRNFKRGDQIRHVEPGMNKQRQKNFEKFEKPIDEIGIHKLFNSDVKFDLTLKILNEMIPHVKSSDKWEEVNLPFMNKHTNVGYPYFKNDRLIDVKTGLTYGQLTSKVAKGLSPQQVVNYPFVAFGRNLRRKARPILGGSRIQALVYNQLEKKEIEDYKISSPLFIGYNDDIVLKEKMVKLAKWLETNDGYTVMNRDFAAFDTTVSPDLRRLIDAITVTKTVDKRGKDIAFWRGVSHYRSQLINGLTGNIRRIYGRIFSGEIDTNAGGGKVNAFVNIYSILHFDPSWLTISKQLTKVGTSPLWVMGDDNLLVQPKKLDDKKYSSFIKTNFKMDVSSEKGEFGIFFLQRRLFKRNNSFVMITPFTRVIRSLASKEMRKGLGPAGWTLATYMLLAQLIEWPELLLDVARIFAPYDEYRLGTVWTVKQLTKLVAIEDKEAIEKGNRKSMSTFLKLNDGDPLKSRWFNSDGSVNEGIVSDIHSILTQGLAIQRK